VHIDRLFEIAREHGHAWYDSATLTYFDDELLAKAAILEKYFQAQFVALRDSLKLRKTEFNNKLKDFNKKPKKSGEDGTCDSAPP
jgi:hypothetical protein